MKPLSLLLLALLFAGCASRGGDPRWKQSEDYRQWSMYGGGPENIHYSALDEINRGNVNQLEVAWTFDTGDAFPGSEMQCNPIVRDGVLYATSPRLRLFALDAASGKAIWTFDPQPGEPVNSKMRNRGLAWWQGGAERRIFYAFRQWLYSIDAATGKPDPAFGAGGRIDLREGLGRDPDELSVSASSPGVVYKDLLILGSIVSEALPAAPGHIRAFDVRTGRLRWIFRTIPRPGDFGHKTWPPDAWQYTGGANNWSGMTLDPGSGRVYIPTGSAAFDFYGANRFGDNLFANTLLCLDASTGKRIWHFQTVRHDVWDRDLPTAPSLITLRRGRRPIEAVVQPTKSGHLFVFDRKHGKPLFPIEEREVSTRGALGEYLSATQPVPLAPPPLSRQKLTEEMLTDRTPEARAAALAQFRKIRSNGQFEPPSTAGTVVFPGFDGGAEWGGPAFDPETGLLYVNANEMAWVLRLVEKPRLPVKTTGKQLYEALCASCHKPDLTGAGAEFPSLANIARKMKEPEIRDLIVNGRGRMPGYSALDENGARAIVRYVAAREDIETTTTQIAASPIDQMFNFDGYNKFLDPEGYPAVKPPWGTLNAVDMNSGAIAWSVPLGEYPELAAKGMRNTGSENYGGGIVTAGGLFFIGATDFDRKFRAFDKRNGELLWETTLPAAGNATPATYEADGRQFVVIGAGGGKWGAASGGSYVAFALPRPRTGQ